MYEIQKRLKVWGCSYLSDSAILTRHYSMPREGPEGRVPGYSQVVSGGVGKPKSSLSLQS